MTTDQDKPTEAETLYTNLPLPGGEIPGGGWYCQNHPPGEHIANESRRVVCWACGHARPGVNFGNPVMRVRHADLVRDSDESLFRSRCPACLHGLLLVRRDQTTLALIRDDVCTLCGQHVHYTDDKISRLALPPEPS